MLLLCAACATFNMGLGTRAWQKEPALGKDAFLAVVESEETIKIVDPNAAVLFWYDFDTPPLGNLYRSVSSEYLWLTDCSASISRCRMKVVASLHLV